MSRTLMEIFAEMDGEPLPRPRASQRADGTSAPSVVVPVRLRRDERDRLDARRLSGESRSDAIRRLLEERLTPRDPERSSSSEPREGA